MKLSTYKNVEVPFNQAFAFICDFGAYGLGAYGRSAMGRGAEVRRMDDMMKPGVGMKWAASFKIRFERPNEICLLSSTSGIDGTG